MAFGDVVIVDLGASRGREQASTRPAAVVHRRQNLPTALVIPFTSKLSALGRFPHTLRVEPDADNGLSVPSVALVFQLTNVDTRKIIREMGRLSPDDVTRLQAELRQILGI